MPVTSTVSGSTATDWIAKTRSKMKEILIRGTALGDGLPLPFFRPGMGGRHANKRHRCHCCLLSSSTIESAGNEAARRRVSVGRAPSTSQVHLPSSTIPEKRSRPVVVEVLVGQQTKQQALTSSGRSDGCPSVSYKYIFINFGTIPSLVSSTTKEAHWDDDNDKDRYWRT